MENNIDIGKNNEIICLNTINSIIDQLNNLNELLPSININDEIRQKIDILSNIVANMTKK
jgi:hypothetical protein